MATTCPKCRFENPDDTNFCGKCATLLPGASGKTPEAATENIGRISGELATGALIAAKYRILAKLGAGGMGEVYRAKDLSLNRQVAIKVLPDVFAADQERLARFQREAKVLAALNHPNIAAIYGVEEAEGKRFLILELVEGETLAERLSRGPLSLEETLDVCRQIAEGLEGAHEKGIIHRDLKPSNVKINPEGKVKILDFGMARAYHDQISEVDIIKSPTITADITQPGVLLGTAAYMSPEQAKGKTVDKRGDIWAFGCILFECLTGRRAFSGETVTDTLAAILKGEPDWHDLPTTTPWKTKDLLRRCLKKDPRERLHDIADIRIEITEAISQPSVSELLPISKVRGIKKTVALILGVFVIGLAATVIALLLKKSPKVPIVQATIDLPAGTQLTRDGRSPTRTELALSPDGKYIVFSASPDGSPAKARLYLRALDSTEAKPIAGTEGARTPFFSPDGQWIGFWTQGKLQKISLTGDIPIPICEFNENTLMGASWGQNGRIIIGTHNQGLQSVDASGGKLERLTVVDSTKEQTHRLPCFLPGAKAVLFTVMPDLVGTQSQIEVLSLETGKRELLIDKGADARFVPTGHLLFLREGKLMAVPFDPDRLKILGPAVPVVEGVMQAINLTGSRDNSGSGQFSFSRSGSLVYAPGGIYPDALRGLIWIDRRGRIEPMTSFGKKSFYSPRLSPNGQKLIYHTVGKERDVWLYDLTNGTSTKLTSEGRATFLNWTPDGEKIVFNYFGAGKDGIVWMPWDRSGPIEPLTTSKSTQYPGSWSPDGRQLAYVERGPANSWDIWIFRKDDRKTVPFISTNFEEGWPEFSPDGRWLAYASNESGRREIYITEIPGPGKKITISSEGGTAPLWARNGRELFYWNLDNTKLMVTDIITQPIFHAGPPRELFSYKPQGAIPIRNYDITPDGQRFLLAERVEIKPMEVTRLNIVLNWFEELKRLCPPGKK